MAGPSPLLRKLLVLAGATLLFLVAGELAVRRCSPMQLGFEFEDGAFRRPREFVRDTKVNSHRFHDREHGPPVEGIPRVVLLGDSYVASKATPLEQTVGSRLEHHLNAAGGRTWEVVILGYEGWGQREELEALEKYGPSTRPAVVVTLFLPFNDFRNNSPELDEIGKREMRGDELPASEVPGLFLEWSVLNRLIAHRLAVARARSPETEVPVDFFAYATESDPVWERAWDMTEALLLETRAAATELGAEYLIASASTPSGVLGAKEGLEFLLENYPAMRGRSWDLDLPDRRLAEFCAEKGIPFLAMEPTFREEMRAGQLLHWRYNGHWTAEGNDLAGRLLAKMILDHVREQ
jgi:hypothetical protein